MSVGGCGPLGGSVSPVRSLGGLKNAPPFFRRTGKSAKEIFVRLSSVYGEEVPLKMSAV